MNRIIMMVALVILASCGAEPVTVPRAECLVAPSDLGGEKVLEAFEGQAGALWVRTSAGRLVKLDNRASFSAPVTLEAAALMGGSPVALGKGALYSLVPSPERILEVPLTAAQMAGEGQRLYISGLDASGEALMFAFERINGHQPILSLPSAPTALVASEGRVYFAMGAGIHTFKPGGEVRTLAALPGLDPIISIAADTRSGILYLSDGTCTYALVSQSSRCVLLFRDAGGELLWSGGALHLSRHQDGCLYRLPDMGQWINGDVTALMDLF
ncbi:MAG: hypothetical protein AB7F75_00940 [Planctomycetota bacterium]